MKYTLAAMLMVAAALACAADEPAATSLDWIGGRWCSQSAQERIEEYWMPARGGTLLGMSRTTRGERLSSFEFMRIVLEPVPTFLAQPGGQHGGGLQKG